MFTKSVLAATLLASAQLVAGHGAIITATGDQGGQGMALGVVTNTPRDGTRRDPFQQDSTRFRGASAQTFGETVGAGPNSLESGTKAIMSEMGGQLPQVSQGGSVDMTLHQVNGDGGGPYECMINADGTGAPNSRNRGGAQTDFPMVAAIPADQTCTGTVAGQDQVCLVRCQNAARAGPFGGVVPVQMAGAANATEARRRLARSILETERTLAKMMKRASTFPASGEKLEAFELEEEAEEEEEE
ncbi:hypothetical protein BN1723_005199 [Verticillium longisporum]|uniref:Uncharacterized protein n=1 Tax=Verticillium longisporum TaxID=100787 RepID=A0A0G4N5E4_VERLO|nr:hypothetical protein BN1723_005199 [Verticillium longisporum]